MVILDHATVEGRAQFHNATLTWQSGPTLDEPNPLGVALKARGASFRGGIDLGWKMSGAVDLSDTETFALADRPDLDWPPESYIAGFTYERFAPSDTTGYAVWDAQARIAWLARLQPFDPRAWEQAAAVLRAAGDQDGADDILVAQRRHARRSGTLQQNRRMWDVLQDATVRYGFRPQRALIALIALIAAVTLSLYIPAAQSSMRTTDEAAHVYVPNARVPGTPPGPCGGGEVRCFSPFFYAVDTVVPIIDLKQRTTWYPSGDSTGSLLTWWLNICTVLGWTASTVFALALTRLGRPR
jgi:hypothetical protein